MSEEKVQCTYCGKILEKKGICWHCMFNDCTPLVNHSISDDEVNRRLHDYCWQARSIIAPDYCADPIRVLRGMRKREDWSEFRDSIGGWKSPYEVVRVDLILDNPGKLARLVLEWIEGRE